MINHQYSRLVFNPHFKFFFCPEPSKILKTPSPFIAEKCTVFQRKKTAKWLAGRKKIGQNKATACSRLGSEIILVKKWP